MALSPLLLVLLLAYLSNAVTLTCPQNYIWNDTAIQCQICPSNSYQTNNTCQPCASLFPFCTYCNSTTCRYCQASLIFNGSACLPCRSIVGCSVCNSTACTSCLAPYVMGYSGCFLCGDVWGNCSDCNSSHCTNCSAPYQLNGSACFVCSDVWPQCTLCDRFSCLNCTAPYVTNGSHCFLCHDQWPNCQQCTASDCLNCTAPYTNNITNCFLCSVQWPNCQECDPSGCLNCTTPYTNNITNCFLCSVEWPNCDTCDGFTCLNCTTPYVLNGSSCFLCQNAWSQCTYCNNIQCLNCTAPHVTNGSDCFLCSDRWPNCDICDGFTCLNCSLSYSFNGTDCFLCSDVWTDCDQCTTTACSRCSSPYTLNTSTLCDLDCPLLIPNCTVCAFLNTHLTCSACDPGLSIQSNQCLPLCGDSQLALNIQTCDDGNTQDNDGCSSLCQIEDYFSCDSTIMPSVCQLAYMEATVKSILKTQDKNEVVLSIDLFPKNLAMYSTADWLSSFSDFSHSMTAQSAQYNPSTNQLQLTLSYSQSLQDRSVQLTANFSSALSSSNLTSLRLALPSTSANNQALYYYSDSSYSLAMAVKYLAWAVAGAAVVLMVVGYFGCKLQSLEGVAVVQVAGLMVMSVENMGPSFSGLSKLKLALGVTVLSGQSSTVPSHLSSIIEANTPYGLINIFLSLFIASLLTALIIKILASTAFKSSYKIQRAYKFALGSYTYYGLMFLTYGQFALFALNLRYFKGEMDCYVGMVFGVAFTAVVVLWVIGSCKYQNWFGCFKKKFFIFQISKYFYLFSTIERFITAFAVVCLSPGIIAPAALCAIFTAQAIFILVKQPYILGRWKRPLFNKITTVVICLLYLAGSVTSAESTINLILPLAILVLLFVVLIVAGVASVYELSEFWSNKDDTGMEKEKDERPMTVEEAQNKVMHDFQQKIMPNLSLNSSIFQPVKHQDSGVDKWKWQNYAVLNSIDLHHQLRTKLKGQRKLNCDQSEVIISEKESDTRLNSPIRRPNYDEI